jgi:hypothetical protein
MGAGGNGGADTATADEADAVLATGLSLVMFVKPALVVVGGLRTPCCAGPCAAAHAMAPVQRCNIILPETRWKISNVIPQIDNIS